MAKTSLNMAKTKEEKSNLGAFYTKSNVITDYIVGKIKLSNGFKILEPCVGDGEFLKAISRVMQIK